MRVLYLWEKGVHRMWAAGELVPRVGYVSGLARVARSPRQPQGPARASQASEGRTFSFRVMSMSCSWSCADVQFRVPAHSQKVESLYTPEY